MKQGWVVAGMVLATAVVVLVGWSLSDQTPNIESELTGEDALQRSSDAGIQTSRATSDPVVKVTQGVTPAGGEDQSDAAQVGSEAPDYGDAGATGGNSSGTSTGYSPGRTGQDTGSSTKGYNPGTTVENSATNDADPTGARGNDSSRGTSAGESTKLRVTIGDQVTQARRSTGTSGGQPTPPIRAAFFYPWFPHAWNQGGVDPFTNFTPSLGRYSSSNPATIRRQLDLASDANIDSFIASWWGRGHHTDAAMPSLLNTTRSAGSPADTLKWSIYYEPEGQGDPSPSRIRQDLDYLAARYFNHDSYLRVNGRPVVFVWADSGDGDAMARRWHEAVSGAPYKPYVVLKVYSGYEDTRYEPDSWHQYGPAKAYSEHLPYSATVSPGFWLKGESPRLGRSVDRFSRDVERMVESGAFWHLITSWNEWGEGTSVEPAREYGNRYLTALAESGTARPTSTPSTAAPPPEQRTTTTTGTSPKPSSGAGVRFSAAGDMGATSATSASLSLMAQRDVEFHLALGDLGYDDVGSEQEWCSYIRSKVASMPMQLLVGNHEDDDREDGHINEFARCMPDSMNSVGQYATEYYFDVGGLARIIMIGADNDVNGVKYDYERGTSHYKWLSDAIDGARGKGLRWVIVGAHKVCITAGKKPCEIGPDLVDLLIDKKVDLVVHGHEHTYQRSKQVRCIEVDRFRSDCVVDDGADDTYGKGRGLVWVVSGAFGGGGLTDINRSDPEFQYLAASMGGNSKQPGRGYLEVELTSNELRAEFIGSTTSYRDRFVIR